MEGRIVTVCERALTTTVDDIELQSLRATALVPCESVGSPGTGFATVPAGLTAGGLRLSTIYQAGLQLNMPVRNRIAQADAARRDSASPGPRPYCQARKRYTPAD